MHESLNRFKIDSNLDLTENIEKLRDITEMTENSSQENLYRAQNFNAYVYSNPITFWLPLNIAKSSRLWGRHT